MKWYYWLLIGIVMLAVWTYGVQGITSHLKDKAFDAREAVRQTKIADQETVINDAAKKIGELQTKISEQEIVITVAGQNAAKVLERVKDENARFEKESEQIGVDIPDTQRCANICTRLERLKLITATKAKECRASCGQ